MTEEQRIKHNARNALWRENNIELARSVARKYYYKLKSDPETYEALKQKKKKQPWYLNREKISSKMLEQQALRKRIYKEQLTDGYIKKLLCTKAKIPYSMIPQELIELKKEQLLIKRKLESHGKES